MKQLYCACKYRFFEKVKELDFTMTLNYFLHPRQAFLLLLSCMLMYVEPAMTKSGSLQLNSGSIIKSRYLIILAQKNSTSICTRTQSHGGMSRIKAK